MDENIYFEVIHIPSFLLAGNIKSIYMYIYMCVCVCVCVCVLFNVQI
jgi:hypothetical protein